jgi:esterase/lipase superfamily enzyme
MSFKDSLKDAGSSLDPGSSVFEFVDFGVIHSRAAELGERLRLSILEALVSKSFQQYYRKATEGWPVHLDEGLFVDPVEAMIVDIAVVTTSFSSLGRFSCARARGTLEPKGV